MAFPTTTEFEEAKEDLDDLEAIVNGVVSVSTRTGGTKQSVAQALANLTRSAPVAYAGSLSMSTGLETIERSSIIYAPLVSALPFTTTGTWGGDDEDKFYPIQMTDADIEAAFARQTQGKTYQYSSSAASNSHAGISAGYVIRGNMFDNNNVGGSGGAYAFTGTTTAGKAGDWPNADGYFYDADGKQFEIVGPEISIAQFGAVGDDSNDDTTAIQAAIVAGYGRTLIIPERTHSVTARLDIENDISIKGTGTLKHTASGAWITLYCKSASDDTLIDVSIKDISINANGGGQLDAGLIQANDCIVHFDNITIIGGSNVSGSSGVNGIAVASIGAIASPAVRSAGTISNCDISGCSKAAINWTTNNRNGLVIGNRTYSNTGNGQCPGIQVNGGGNCKVIGNYCYDNEGAGIVVAVLGSTPAIGSSNTIISQNHCYGNGTGAIQGAGIHVLNAHATPESRVIVTENFCYSNGAAAQDHGIKIENHDHVSVIGNHCYDNPFNGIFIDVCDDVIVKNNMLYDNNTASNSTGAGVGLRNVTNAVISENSIRDCDDNGMIIYSGCSDISIWDNQISGVTTPLNFQTDALGSGFRIRNTFEVQTTSTTPVNVFLFPLATNISARVAQRTVAREGSSNRALYDTDVLIYNNAGTATVQGTNQTNHAEESDATWACVIDVTGASIRGRVTGNSNTVDWKYTLELQTI